MLNLTPRRGLTVCFVTLLLLVSRVPGSAIAEADLRFDPKVHTKGREVGFIENVQILNRPKNEQEKLPLLYLLNHFFGEHLRSSHLLFQFDARTNNRPAIFVTCWAKGWHWIGLFGKASKNADPQNGDHIVSRTFSGILQYDLGHSLPANANGFLQARMEQSYPCPLAGSYVLSHGVPLHEGGTNQGQGKESNGTGKEMLRVFMPLVPWGLTLILWGFGFWVSGVGVWMFTHGRFAFAGGLYVIVAVLVYAGLMLIRWSDHFTF